MTVIGQRGNTVNARKKANPVQTAGNALVRRDFLLTGALTLPVIAGSNLSGAENDSVFLPEDTREEESLFGYLDRVYGKIEVPRVKQLLGACNEFKEGDAAVGLAAENTNTRETIRALLRSTTIDEFRRHPIHKDEVTEFSRSAIDHEREQALGAWTFGELVAFILDSDQAEIQRIAVGLDSDVIACVVKLMNDEQLSAVGAKIFNPLPQSQIGAQGYLSARIQPNSPTDNIEDIQWQVFNGWAYGVGDALLGTNPVSSEVSSVAAIEKALAEIIDVFELRDALPHCVLAHIDVQSEVEEKFPGSTALWFQSLAGVEDANTTFDISVAKMVRHAKARTGRYGLYFETGQGADATNGHSKQFDMVIHESRKYGFARALKKIVSEAQAYSKKATGAWVHVNDVAGFIGPEVFRTREQLVRCCLEDIVMGKLHGLTIGLDICSTLHMEIDLDDLDWCIDQIMPACPAYLMALPTKNDPMLSYLTTSFQDHVRVRHRFGYRVNDAMWSFFQSIGIIDQAGNPTEHFGQPAWVYLQFCRRKGDQRPDETILREGQQKIAQVRGRGVPIAAGHGDHPWDMDPDLDRQIRGLFEDSKRCIWAELPEGFAREIPNAVLLSSQSTDREDYILHPPTGEKLSEASVAEVHRQLRKSGNDFEVQIVISDGLNALALTDELHLAPFLQALKGFLESEGLRVGPQTYVIRSGRVRAGYQVGELVFGGIAEPSRRKAVLHVIGERPGSGHHAFSVYVCAPTTASWSHPGEVDHNITKVVSGIADTALSPSEAAAQTVKLLQGILATPAGNFGQ